MLRLPGGGRGGAGRAGYGQGRDVRMTIGSHSGSILCPQLSSAQPVTGFIQVGNFKLRLNCNLDPLAGVGASVMPGPASSTAICLLSCCHGPWGHGQQICENCSEGDIRTQHINTPFYVPHEITIFISWMKTKNTFSWTFLEPGQIAFVGAKTVGKSQHTWRWQWHGLRGLAT